MKAITTICSTVVVAILLLQPLQVTAQETGERLFFLHHSTGRNLLGGELSRAYLEQVNAGLGTQFVLWDHDYNYIGLNDAEADPTGYDYGIPGDNTDPDGLAELFTTANAARDSIFSRYDVIAFKSCFPVSEIDSQAQLDDYKQHYLAMRDVFSGRKEKTFVVLSPPPRHRLATDVESASYARQFADWLGSAEYLAGHANIVMYDFFDDLAQPDDGSPTANMLRYEYEVSHEIGDSHPNYIANQTLRPVFVDVLVAAALGSVAAHGGAMPHPVVLEQNAPNPFNPATTIAFTLERESAVSLDVFDVHGGLVARLADGTLAAGRHQVWWRGADDAGRTVSSGTYLYRLTTAEGELTRKMTLAR